MSNFKLATTSENQQRITIMSRQLNNSELEKKRVSEQLQEVIRMNTHWQRYDSQREEYVMKLTRTNQDLQDKVSDLQHQLNGLHKHHNKHEHQGISSWQDNETKSKVSASRKQQTYNASPLGFTSLNNEEEIVTLTDHVAKLKIRICELENERVVIQKQSDEQTVLLREQIKICVDDFKQERKDRERCHEENVRLQKRLAHAENDLKSREEKLYIHQEQIKQQQDRRRCNQDYTPTKRPFDEPRYYAQDRPDPRYQTYSRSRHTPAYFHRDYGFTDLPRDVEIDGESEGYDEIDGALKRPPDEVDGPSEQDLINIEQASKYDLPDGGQHMPYEKYDRKTYEKQLPEDERLINTTEDSEENINGKEELLCPKCNKSFGVLKHLELLDHIYICTENE